MVSQILLKDDAGKNHMVFKRGDVAVGSIITLPDGSMWRVSQVLGHMEDDSVPRAFQVVE